jgi:predicted helicase
LRSAVADDPLLYCHERFLAAHDPALRGLRGVYVTPGPVARYVVRAVLDVLGDAFGVRADAPDGAFTVLDPACGTGVFLHELIAAVRARFIERDDPRGWHAHVRGVLLRRLRGFELLAVPHAVAHLKLTQTLRGDDLAEPLRTRFRCELGPRDRLRIELANALGVPPREAGARGRAGAAGEIVVVLGNPPYSGHSANPRSALLRDYLAGVGEANTKWLHDDYVKFVRFAEDAVERAGRGIVALVTNHAYLDNPTFAGMRRHLMRTFDEIFVLDLHGNAKIVETAPGGSADENVFDIRQGVAVGVFVRRNAQTAEHCTVKLAELFGSREKKLAVLEAATLRSTAWTAVVPNGAASFRPSRARVPLGYAEAPSLRDAMPVASLGVLTKRDALAVAFTREELLERLAVFADPSVSDERTAEAFGLPLRDNDRWRIAGARRVAAGADPAHVRALQYRCGDVRYYYDADGIVARRNRRVLDHVAGAVRCAFLVGRQGGAATSGTWDSVWASAVASDQNLFRRGGATVFPLVLGAGERRTAADGWNFSETFLRYAAARTGARDLAGLPRRAAGYVYGLLNAPRFRAEFASELKRDFPRIPIVGRDSFGALSEIGWALLRLHLLADVAPQVTFAADGGVVVDARRVAFADAGADGYGSVVVDARGRRFERVHRHAWLRTCGGSPVLASYLRARRGRRLGPDEIRAFTVLATALDGEQPLFEAADAVVAALLA